MFGEKQVPSPVKEAISNLGMYQREQDRSPPSRGCLPD